MNRLLALKAASRLAIVIAKTPERTESSVVASLVVLKRRSCEPASS
jgi:hypothetical protein